MSGTRLETNRQSIVICCGATSCAVVAGYAISFSSVAMDDLLNEEESVHLTKEQATWFGSLLPLMAIFGSLLSGPLMDSFGRRIALLSVVVCFMISWLLMHQSYEIYILFIGRGLSGVATGMTTAIIPMYISEVSPNNLRGTMGGVFSVALALGLPIGYCSGIRFNWRHVAKIGAAISCVSFLIIYLLPESHYWLIKQQKVSDAIKTIKVLRGSSYDYSQEFEDIQFLQKELNNGRATFTEITSISFLKPVGIGMALMVFQQCSGVNVIFFYAHDIFRRAGFDNVSQRNVMDGKSTAKDFNASIPNNVFLHNFTFPIDDNVSGFEVYTKISPGDETTEQDFAVSWACLIFVMLYIAMYSIGMGPVPFIVLSEMVPFSGRGVACGIGTMCNWLCAFILTKSFITFVEIFELYGVFWLFSTICLISTIFIWRFVPETSGKTLAEIQDLLKTGSKKKASSPNEQKFFCKLLRRPMSSSVCTKSTSSMEEQTREFIESCQDA